MSKTPHQQAHIQVLRLSSLEYAKRQQMYQSDLHSAAKFTLQESTSSSHNQSHPLKVYAQRTMLLVMAVLITLFYPVGAYATEATPPTPEETTVTTAPVPEPEPTATSSAPDPEPTAPAPAPAPKKTGPQQPTGADAPKYAYNDTTGMWESDKYAWDPNTGQTKPLEQPTYSYNPKTNMWDTTEWKYDAPTGTYKPNVVSAAQAPDNQTGVDSNSSNAATFNLFYDAKISNNVSSTALTGDALVAYNTQAGSATTGNALSMATIMNMLQSSGSFGGEIATFSSDIHGDVVGDLYIDPTALAALQPAAGSSSDNTDLQVQADVNGLIENNVDLNATSGNATVTYNTQAGSATTGDAHAVANIINMMNSAISSGGAFVGSLNIHGNFNGDILLPEGVLDQLLAANAPQTNLSSQNITNSEVLADFTDNQTITNNITTGATSGNATVDGNTTAGSAASGDSNTNITVLNLTGRNVIAANSLLVFVNVLGEWVGVIMDAPTGSTSAALGTGVTQNATTNLAAQYEVDSNSQIHNNVNVQAASGDATVANNTTAGDATSGNATASANIVNIMNSSISLADWFGVLFINVFGKWEGSFGVNTAAGTLPKASSVSGGETKGVNREDVRVFKFVPKDQGSFELSSVQSTSSFEAASQTAVQAATAEKAEDPQEGPLKSSDIPTPAADIREQDVTKTQDYWLPFAGFMLGSSLLATDHFTNRRRNKLTK